jgi:hypothetical protein
MLDNAFKIKVAGRAAPADMGPDQYLAQCISAEVKQRGSQVRAVLTFRCEAGRFDGVLLTCWLAIHKTVAAHHKFARAYQIAMDRDLHVDEEISLGGFIGKLFVVQAAFRKGRHKGKKWVPEDPAKSKDKDDFLRVHDILSLADSATAASDGSHEQGRTKRARRVVKLASRGVEHGDE